MKKTGKVYVDWQLGRVFPEEDFGPSGFVARNLPGATYREAHQLDVLADIKNTESLLQDCASRILRLNKLYIRARKFDPNHDECPGCGGSEYPGRIYNNNDITSGQYFNCVICNPDGDLSA
jgi:hypothetical protein